MAFRWLLLDFCIQNKKGLAQRFHVKELERMRGIIVFLISEMVRTAVEIQQSNLTLSMQFVEKLMDGGKTASTISTNYDIIVDNY